jgi:hypothetical protein
MIVLLAVLLTSFTKKEVTWITNAIIAKALSKLLNNWACIPAGQWCIIRPLHLFKVFYRRTYTFKSMFFPEGILPWPDNPPPVFLLM